MTSFGQIGPQQIGDGICAGAFLIAGLWAAVSPIGRLRKGLLVLGCAMMVTWTAAMGLSGDQAGDILLVGTLEILRDLAWIAFLLSMPGVGLSLTRLAGRRGPLFLAAALAAIAGAVVQAMVSGRPSSLTSPEVLLPVFALALIETLYRNNDTEGRWGIKTLCLGLGLLFVFEFVFHVDTLFAGRPETFLVEGRGIVDALAVPLILLSVHRSGSWRRTIRFSRDVVFHSAVLLGSGLYLLVMAALGLSLHLVGGSPAIQMVFLIATTLAMLMVVSSKAFRSSIRVTISKHFFRHRYDYRDIWLKFVRDISHQGNDGDLQHRVLHAVADILDCPCGALWVLQPDEDSFAVSAAWNFGDALPAEPADSPLAHYLCAHRGIVELPDFRRFPSKYPGLALPAWLAAHPRAWLLAPLIHNARLRGFVVLGVPRAAVDITWEEVDLLKTIGEQAASYLTEDLTLRALVDATRLEEFNRWSAFLVHDIKGIVGQMSLLVANAEIHADDHAFQRDVVATVANAVTRMRQILDQLHNRRHPNLPQKTKIDAAVVLRQVGDRWRKSIPNLTYPANAPTMTVEAREDSLISVLDHLIQNAFEASGAGGQITLGLRWQGVDGLLEVRDDGPGMDPGFIREKLFRPLASDKPNGFGLGAFQARQMVRGMGGKLEVESVPGRGTTMRVRLPIVAAGSTAQVMNRESV